MIKSKIDKGDNKLKRIILFCFILASASCIIYYFISGNKEYEREVERDLKGIVTAKYRVQENNPKSVNIRINDSTIYQLPFSLISEIYIGDTIIKEIGNDYYTFFTKARIIRMKIPRPNLFGYPKNWRGSIEINSR